MGGKPRFTPGKEYVVFEGTWGDRRPARIIWKAGRVDGNVGVMGSLVAEVFVSDRLGNQHWQTVPAGSLLYRLVNESLMSGWQPRGMRIL